MSFAKDLRTFFTDDPLLRCYAIPSAKTSVSSVLLCLWINLCVCESTNKVSVVVCLDDKDAAVPWYVATAD